LTWGGELCRTPCFGKYHKKITKQVHENLTSSQKDILTISQKTAINDSCHLCKTILTPSENMTQVSLK
jgi:hypothetical protein